MSCVLTNNHKVTDELPVSPPGPRRAAAASRLDGRRERAARRRRRRARRRRRRPAARHNDTRHDAARTGRRTGDVWTGRRIFASRISQIHDELHVSISSRRLP